MKKYFIVILILLLGVFIVYKTVVLHDKRKELKEITFYGKQIWLTDINGNKVNLLNDIKSRKAMLLYYNSLCEHCQNEIREIIGNKEKFRGKKIVMISDEKLSAIKKFGIDYKIFEVSFIRLLQDSDDQFYNTFGMTIVPSAFFIDEKGSLEKECKGETKVSMIVKYLD